MPLNSTNFVLNGHATSADLMQFVNLLTGVMTDQPVTVTNTLTATTHLGNGTVPSGGAAGQVLSKGSAASYNVGWTTPFSQANADALYLPLTGGTLTGNLLFGADNTRDIGTSGATRPRNVYVGTSVVVGGGTTLTLGSAGPNAFVAQAIGGSLTLGTNNTGRWNVDFASGAFLAQTDNTTDIGASGANRPRNVYAATAFIGPGALPPGGAAGQGIIKNTATSYDVAWAAVMTQTQGDARYLPLTGGTLAGPGNLTVSGVLSIRTANETLQAYSGTGVSTVLKSADGYVNVAGFSTVLLSTNAYYDGTQWNRINTGTQVMHVNLGAGINLLVAPAGTGINPPWVSMFNVDTSGNVSQAGTLALTTPNTGINIAGQVAFGDVNSGDLYLDATGQILFRSAGGSQRGHIDASSNLVMNGTIVGTAGVQSLNGYLYCNNGAAQAQMINDGTNILFRTATSAAGSTIYLQNSAGQNALTANTSGVQVIGTLQVQGNVIYLEPSNAVLIRYRGDLGGVEIPYGNGIYTTNIHLSGVYLEGSNAVYINYRGDLASIYTSYSLYVGGGIQSTSGITVNLARGANQGGITLLNNAGSGYDATIFSEGGNLYFWYSSIAAAANFQHQGGASWQPLNASAYNVVSTRKDKRDLVPLDQGVALATVMDERVAPVGFRYEWEDERRVGFVAEDMVRVVPEAVALDDNGDPHSIHYGALVPVLWGAIRELSAQVEALKMERAA
jgi:hypothetical protein